MKIKHYLSNAFIVESGNKKIAIDPGLDAWIFRLKSYIPKSEWDDITHIVLTHGDPDHHWPTDRIAAVSGASFICGQELVRQDGNETYLYNPRAREIDYDLKMDPVYPMKVGDIVRDMEPLFKKFGFEFTNEEIGGYGRVHMYVAKKR